MADGVSLLRGPVIKSSDSYYGWVDLTPENIRVWQDRIRAIRASAEADLVAESSSSRDRLLTPGREWDSQKDILDIGEIVAWIMDREEGGRREKG